MGIEQGTPQPEVPKQENLLITSADIPWSVENPQPEATEDAVQTTLEPEVGEAARNIVSWPASEGKIPGVAPVEVATPPNPGTVPGWDGITRR